MIPPKDGLETLYLLAEAEQVELYKTLGGLLQRLVVRHFNIPPDEAEILVYETFILYYGNGMKAVARERPWLITAVFNNARTYLERRGQAAGKGAPETRSVESSAAHRDAVATLDGREREALRLRFAEQKSYPPIAEALGVSTFAAKQIVTRTVAKVRALLRGTRG